ncbi:MAG: glycosyltransferase family 4 protein [Rhodothermales bacterium]|nr:glycosyltransferase family 4 protein [Rhodothermales bacterium]
MTAPATSPAPVPAQQPAPGRTTAEPVRRAAGERPLRIALVADPYIPVPPLHYGGIERILHFLVSGLVERGHEVVLWAAPGSEVPCEVVEYGSPPHFGTADRARELLQVSTSLLRRRREFDVVHSFGRLANLLPLFAFRIPKVQSYQRAISPRGIRWASRLAGDTITFTACSTNCRRPVSHLGRWETVYNGVRLSDFAFRPAVEDDAPLVFLGRIERIKGAHTAIAVAKATGRRLVLAGNVVEDAPHKRYFEEEIVPHLDGERIEYVGPVNDVQKNELLGRASAFLMPIEWEEPFGIVMAEALACGTPVVGFRRGSVPEVVEHGASGFVCDTPEEMAEAVARVGTLDRADARARAERHFSDRVIVDAYEDLYRRVLSPVRR